MKSLKCLLLLSCLVGLSACDKYSKLTHDQKVDLLMERSSSQMALQQTPRQAEPIVQQFGASLDEAGRNQLKAQITDLLNPPNVLARLKTPLSKNFSDPELVEVLKFTDSDLSKNMQKLIAATSEDPGVAEKIQIFQAELKKNPPSEKRLGLMKRYDELSGMSKLTIDMMLSSADLMFKLNPVPKGQPDPIAYIKSQGFMDMLKENTLVGFQFALRDVSDSDLEKYLKFLETPAGQKYTQLTNSMAIDLNADLMKVVETAALSTKKAAPAAPKAQPKKHK